MWASVLWASRGYSSCDWSLNISFGVTSIKGLQWMVISRPWHFPFPENPFCPGVILAKFHNDVLTVRLHECAHAHVYTRAAKVERSCEVRTQMLAISGSESRELLFSKFTFAQGTMTKSFIQSFLLASGQSYSSTLLPCLTDASFSQFCIPLPPRFALNEDSFFFFLFFWRTAWTDLPLPAALRVSLSPIPPQPSRGCKTKSSSSPRPAASV